jgi:hypothetical protein
MIVFLTRCWDRAEAEPWLGPYGGDAISSAFAAMMLAHVYYQAA